MTTARASAPRANTLRIPFPGVYWRGVFPSVTAFAAFSKTWVWCHRRGGCIVIVRGGDVVVGIWHLHSHRCIGDRVPSYCEAGGEATTVYIAPRDSGRGVRDCIPLHYGVRGVIAQYHAGRATGVDLVTFNSIRARKNIHSDNAYGNRAPRRGHGHSPLANLAFLATIAQLQSILQNGL